MEPGATSTLPCGSEAENGPPSPGDVDELVDTALPTKEGTMLTGKEYLVEHDTLKQLCNLCRSNLLLGVEMLDDWYGVRGVLKIGPPSDKLGLLEASNNLKIKEEESTVGGGGGGGEFSDGARERKTPSMTPSLSPVPEGLPTTLPDSPKHALPPPKVPKRMESPPGLRKGLPVRNEGAPPSLKLDKNEGEASKESGVAQSEQLVLDGDDGDVDDGYPDEDRPRITEMPVPGEVPSAEMVANVGEGEGSGSGGVGGQGGEAEREPGVER